jgi:hypothetical protein
MSCVISSSAPKRKGTDSKSRKFEASVAISKKSKKIPTEFAGVNSWMTIRAQILRKFLPSRKNKKSDASMAPL